VNITLLGTGTSQGIPVIGCTCEVCLSSDSKDKRLRVSCYVEDTKNKILIDIGPDFRQQMLTNKISDIDAVLDASFITEEAIGLLQNLDVLVVNALRKEEHYSHFNLEEALAFISQVGPKQSYLTHISHAFDTHSNISKLLPDQVSVGYDGLTIRV